MSLPLIFDRPTFAHVLSLYRHSSAQADSRECTCSDSPLVCQRLGRQALVAERKVYNVMVVVARSGRPAVLGEATRTPAQSDAMASKLQAASARAEASTTPTLEASGSYQSLHLQNAFTRYKHKSAPPNSKCSQRIVSLSIQRRLVFLRESRILASFWPSTNSSYHHLHRGTRYPIRVYISTSSGIPSHLPWTDCMGERCVSGAG